MKINEIHLNPKNPRIIKDEKYQKLKKSIKEFPKMMKLRPIVVDDNMTIIGGNMRYRILQDLGYKEIPEGWVVKASELTEEEKRRFIITDNLPYGDWNWEILGNEWELGELEEWGMELPEIDLKKDEDIEEQDAPIENKDLIKVENGDIYKLNKHRIMCADCTDKINIKKLIDNEIIDLCLTDPPYNLGYEYNEYKDNKTPEEYKKWCELWFENIKEISEQILITPGLQNLSMWFEIEKPKWILCWLKRNAQSGCTLRGFNRHEPIILYGKYEPIIFWGNVKKIIPEDFYDIEIDKKEDVYDIRTAYFEDYEKDKPHSCPKPIRLFARLIKDFTSPGHIILDNFIGSGTSLIASERMHRVCYGMDIDPYYISITIKRWENYTGGESR